MYRLCEKMMRMLALSMGLAGIASVPARAIAVPSASEASAANSAPSDADWDNAACATGEEQFLPGDYYSCLATQRYGLHHYVQARKFFTTAASWASKPAQYVLGIMALDGDHQPANRPLAAAWLALAQMRPTYGDTTTAVRADPTALLRGKPRTNAA